MELERLHGDGTKSSERLPSDGTEKFKKVPQWWT